jgi:hypothetical protein
MIQKVKAGIARTARLILPQSVHDRLLAHLFRGDYAEHAAVILAGWHRSRDGHRLLARELLCADEPRDYRVDPSGFNALQPTFIHRAITRCRDRRLVYLAVHNHGGSGSVAFSGVDLDSHERGYPALSDIAAGMPVGALVIADGAMELDLWLPDRTRVALKHAEVIGHRRLTYYASPSVRPHAAARTGAEYARQELFLGPLGQALLRDATVAIIGLGGVGSIVNELLARLGIGHLVLIDPDAIEPSNFSRIVGATSADLSEKTLKVRIAERVAQQASAHVRVTTITGDAARVGIARQLLDSDYLFLAADSMRARLVFNAIAHQYFIPGVQMGTKITIDADSRELLAAHSSVRHIVPGAACLVCNQLVDFHRIADEWKTERERAEQRYGTSIADPSVITMNAVAAAHAVNDFLMYYVGLAQPADRTQFRRFDHLRTAVKDELPRRSADCTECSTSTDSRFGMGDAAKLPCAEG